MTDPAAESLPTSAGAAPFEVAPFEVAEASIATLRTALADGSITSVGLVQRYLDRIDAYDGGDDGLHAMVVPNSDVLAEAAESDERRRRGAVLGPLDGIPYTAKDSYLVRGLTAAAGSPAFAHLIAQRDAFTIERLRAAGAVLIGLTNMPPMANGGMQRGLYGRAESPYNRAFLTAAFASGSSNGSGTATAASFAAFGLAEETWSSGRAPASNNALCAYTPSRGVISVRGNWPLVPTMDVVVPHTRCMADLLEVLDVVVADDPEPRGDFWRVQPWVPIPAASAVRPASYRALAVTSDEITGVLHGCRLGVPRMYVNDDPLAGTGERVGIGGPTGTRIETRASVIALWEALRSDLEAAGAEVVPVDLPVVSDYEADRPGASTVRTRGLVPPEFLDAEVWELAIRAWNDFLEANADPALHRLSDVDGPSIAPPVPGALPDHYTGFDVDLADYPVRAREHGVPDLLAIPSIAEGLRGLEATRRTDFDDWLTRLGLTAVLFPAVADVGPATADIDEQAAASAWRNGVWVANGNLVWRHLGIPTVTLPMGTMADTGMPVGVTLAGAAYDDTRLLRLASAIEAMRKRRTLPTLTPPLTPPLAQQPR